MSSGPGLGSGMGSSEPERGSRAGYRAGTLRPGTSVTMRVCAVSLHPEVPILRLWGLLGERDAAYVRLHRQIQVAAGPRLAASPDPSGLAASEAELCVGNLGLVEVVGRWHRCCVVSRRGQRYRVFLLDEGCVVVTSAYYLARGCQEFFHLPPEVLGFVVADVVPSGSPRVAACGDAPVSTWAVEAVEFLTCLHGREMSGLVQEVVTPQVIVLELPQLVAQMHHLGLARQVTHSWFSQVLKRCLTYGHLRNQLKQQPPARSHVNSTVPQLLHVLLSCQPVTVALDYFYPRLQLGVMEPVLVTHVSDPHHIYCQLQSLSQEIRCLSDTMRHTYDQWEQVLLPKVGSPCAARGRDGQWYRALLLELIAGQRDEQAAVVTLVDYGRKETVSRANLRHLPVECFRMPVVTYVCALQGVSDGGGGWSPSQIDELKALVLGKAVSARIDTFNSFEHLYYVNMYGENGIDLNRLFGVLACCLLSQTEAQEQPEVKESTAEELGLPPGVPPVPVAGVHLKLGAFHDAQVSYLRDPSEFWLQLREHCQLFRQLSQSMWNFYSHATKLDGAGWDLQPGSLCCASGKEGGFYRAVITRVLDSGVEIHLMDRGNTESVDRCVVKELLPRFQELPALALKCCLAGVTPLRGSWSESSVSAFGEIVRNKGLKVHFLSVQGDKYMVDIFDQSQLGEKSVSKLMALGGYAEYQKCEVPKTPQKSSDKAVSQASCPAEAGEENQGNAEKRPGEEPDLKRNDRAFNPYVALVRESPVAATDSSKSSESVPAQKHEGKENLPVSQRQSYVERKPSSPYGCQLEVGSTVDVVVSYVENPGYFWCQLSRNYRHFELLMAEIQEYCKNSSHPHAWPNSVCLAQYSEDKKWYRAVITGEVSCAEKVEVVYVDYGNRELVSLTNLRSTNKHFLRLEAQAFRCSLYNLIQANGQDPFAWDEAAIQAFQEFVDTSSSCFELKCTIFALASIHNKELFNIVDLMTPFQSACQFLTDRGVARCLAPEKCLVSSVQLHSYYYSMHGIKIGSEEDVFITHVEDPWTFYCQLERCADDLAQLSDSIGRLTETTTPLKTSQKCRTLCLAKYTDNHWYRGVIMKTEPNTEVFFVDFGNTETTEKDHLLPLPSDACDILLLPMQAIKCSLSDISFLPKEATPWFKQAVLEKQLKAIVVGKESDGKLLIELFDGNTQINAKLKEEFSLINNTELYGPVEDEPLRSRNADVSESEATAETPLNTGRLLEGQKSRSEVQAREGSSKRHFKEDDVNLFQPDKKGDLETGLLESDEMFSSKKNVFSINKAGEESLLFIQVDTQSDVKSDAEEGCIMLKNVSGLLQQKIVPALKASVYVSHVNNPLDFYVQLESEETQLNSISESLNGGTQAKNPCGQLFQAGDLISAVYSEDSLWYRAVVKEKISGNLLSIQYIDYGNTSVINVDQAHRLPEDLASIPAISTRCFLGGLKCQKKTDWAEKTVLLFTKRTSDVLLTCQFVEKVEDKWEVILSDHQGVITVDLGDESLASGERTFSREILDSGENRDMVTVCEPLPARAQSEISCVSDRKSFIWKFPEAGQTLKIYVTVANSPEHFWSHSADLEDLSYIELKIEEAENLGLKSLNDCRSSIKTGDVCLAKCSHDGKFYRAKVISVKDDNVVVRHVDYGSEEAVSTAMVRQIPCGLLEVPNQAFACCLAGFSSSEGSWLSGAEEKFYNMTKDLLLEAEIIGTQEDKAAEVPLCLVKLKASGKSINEEMKLFWKANKGTGDSVFSSLKNPLKEKGYSNNDTGLCLERETAAVCRLAQEESESALLCCEPFLGVTLECLHTVEANVSVGAVGFMSGKGDGGCETAEHHSSFAEEILLPEGESDNSVFPEPRRSYGLCILGSERKAAEQEFPEEPFREDTELKAELEGSVSAASLFLGDKQELQRLPVLQVQPSSRDETGRAAEVGQLQMYPSYDDLKELILELEALPVQSSLGEETKEALETESQQMQIVSGSEAREEVLERELFELPVVSEEMGHLEALKFLDIFPSFKERENLMPSVSGGEKTVELIPSDVQLSLGEKAKNLELDLCEIHKAEALQGDWIEVEPPPLGLSSSGDRPEKQLDVKPHDVLSMLGAEIEQLLELVPDVQPSQEGGKEDSFQLERAGLQSSANCGSQLSFLTKVLTNQRPVGIVESRACEVEKCEEWQKKKDERDVEEWMKGDLADSFKECGNTRVQSSDRRPGDEEVEKKKNANLADCSAEHNEYTCNLKGFAVGSKCVVWTSLKWCEARILEVSEEGTRVLNLSSGTEEMVDPENVWNGIPDWACRSSEARTPATENVQALPEESLLQEKPTACSLPSAEDPHVLQHY